MEVTCGGKANCYTKCPFVCFYLVINTAVELKHKVNAEVQFVQVVFMHAALPQEEIVSPDHAFC